jgi:hypothetical protein
VLKHRRLGLSSSVQIDIWTQPERTLDVGHEGAGAVTYAFWVFSGSVSCEAMWHRHFLAVRNL